MIKIPKKGKIVILVLLVLVVAGLAYLLRHYIFSKLHGSDSIIGSVSAGTAVRAPNTLYFDMEPADTVNYNKDELYKGIAHSGSFSAKAFGKNTYSSSINKNVSEVGLQNMKMIGLSAWVYVFPGDEPVEASLVFSGFNGNTNITWQGLGIKGKDVPKGQWFKVSSKFDLSAVPFTNDSRFQIYFWNNSPADILVDDLYISFGAPSERRGDSTLADMTQGAFSPKFNTPPFPFSYLVKQNTGDVSVIILEGSDYTITSGNFLSSGSRDIIVNGKGKSAGFWTWCQQEGVFIHAGDIPDEIKNADLLMAGDFTGSGKNQLFVSGKISVIYSFTGSGNICSGGAKVTPEQVWRGIISGISDKTVAADIDGDNHAELVSWQKDGTWTIARYNGNGWNSASVKGEMPEGTANAGISAGRFFKKVPADVILAVFADNNGRTTGYDILRFDRTRNLMATCFREKYGKTIGRDTLKVNDHYFAGGSSGTENNSVFRYNRDWRFDMKEITFSDSSFRILSTVDFKGYPAGRNPKYYEKLFIVPFTVNDKNASFLIIQKNPASGLLPDAAGIYSTAR